MLQHKRIFFPNLDGLRFFAFFSVFLFHSFFTKNPSIQENQVFAGLRWLTRPGDIGVNFFFVLSGFLITFLLLSERQFTGRIAIAAFYMRRVLRIWPLYFVVVLIGFVVFPWLKVHFGETTAHEPAQLWYYLAFLANFNNIYNGSNTPTLTLLWSVAVEEQFYLVWPLLVAAVPSSKMGWLFGAVMALSLAFRAGHTHELAVLHFHTFSLIGDMALGGLVAWLCWRDDRLITAVARWPRWVIGVGYLMAIVLVYSHGAINLYLPGYLVFDRLVLALFCAFVLLEQNYAQHSFFKVSQLRFPTYWGTYTYGLYCLHFLALLAAYQILHRLHLNDTVAGAVFGDNALGLLIALALSWTSFNLYEKPFLKLKERFAFITRDKPTPTTPLATADTGR
jgi:peptidoglycan/LPS O-acetylase OafA/YrhL